MVRKVIFLLSHFRYALRGFPLCFVGAWNRFVAHGGYSFIQFFYDQALSGVLNELKSGDLSLKQELFLQENESGVNEESLLMADNMLLPKISIVTPTYNTKPKMLSAMLSSVLKQSYRNWELIIVDDGSSQKNVLSLLAKYAQRDSRIKVVPLKQNMGVAYASNVGIKAATGEVVIFLDHDDLLLSHSVLSVAKAFINNPEAQFAYSDYLLSKKEGKIVTRVFCPEFCRWFYWSHPYIVHLVAIKKTLLTRVGGYREKVFKHNVAHDVDLFLRCFNVLPDNEIIHIPEILYVWRSEDFCTSHVHQKMVMDYSIQAIQENLIGELLDARVEPGLIFNCYRVRPPLFQKPLVSIIILSPPKNYQILKENIKSIIDIDGYSNFEIIIVKHKWPKELNCNELGYGVVTDIDYNGTFNYSTMNNLAARKARGEYLLFLNDDIIFSRPDSISSMVELCRVNTVGIVGAKLIFPDGKIQHAGVVLGYAGIAGHWHRKIDQFIGGNSYNPGYLSCLTSIREYSAVTGACLMIKASLFAKLNGFDQAIAVEYGDVDLCLRGWQSGFKVLYTPYAEAIHLEHNARKVTGDLHCVDDQQKFIKKWKFLLEQGDRCFHRRLLS